MGWSYYFYYLIPFGVLGGILMYSIADRQSLKKRVAPPAAPARN
jgi:OPA family glycerol-3-phosphate transporter-like MFS transporter